jgi:hypothetical protein
MPGSESWLVYVNLMSSACLAPVFGWISYLPTEPRATHTAFRQPLSKLFSQPIWGAQYISPLCCFIPFPDPIETTYTLSRTSPTSSTERRQPRLLNCEERCPIGAVEYVLVGN